VKDFPKETFLWIRYESGRKYGNFFTKKSGAALRVPLEQNPFYRMKQNYCGELGLC